MINPAEITAMLRRQRLPVSNEAVLQIAIAAALTANGITFEREARLGPGERIDFLASGCVGIEAKTRYARRAIYRQLERYAQHASITALILITGTALGLPSAIDGKPLFYVSLGRAAL